MKDKNDVDGKENWRFMIMITIMLVLIETVVVWLAGWLVSAIKCNQPQPLKYLERTVGRFSKPIGEQITKTFVFRFG